MSLEQQPSQELKPLSLMDRLNRAKAAVVEKQQTIGKAAVTRLNSSRSHAENFKSLSAGLVEYNELKDIAFETYFKTLARDLQKNDQALLQDFDAKWREMKDIKKALSEFDEAPAAIKDDKDLCEEFEAARSIATETMREWAKTLSEWFSEHAQIGEVESKEVGDRLQMILNDPLYAAEYRAEDETFDDASRRTIQEFSDKEGDKIRDRLGRTLVYFEINSEDSSWDSLTRDLLSFTRDPVVLFAEMRKIVANPKRNDLEKHHVEFESEIKKIYPNLQYHLSDRTSDYQKVEKIQQLLLNFDKLLNKADAIERAAEAQRAYSEKQLAQVIDIIDKEFKTDVERQDALTFVKLADDQAHNKPSHTTFSGFRGSFRVGEYGGNPPPKWLITVYKKLNNIHLFNALLRGDLEDVESRIGEDQLLRAISNEPTHGNSEPDESITTNAKIAESEGYFKIVTPSQDTKSIRSTYPLDNPGNAKSYYKATLDPEIITQVEPFWKNLTQQGALPKEKVISIGVLRSFFAECSIQGISYESQQINPQRRFDGFEKGLHIMSTELKNRASYFVNDVDLRLVEIKPTAYQRLSEIAKRDGVVELTSIEDAVHVVSALKLMISRYLAEEKPKLVGEADAARAAAKAAEESANEIRHASELESGNLRERIDAAVRPHQEVAEKNRRSADSLAEQLLSVQNEYVEMKKRLEGQVRDLTARNLTYSTEVSSLNNQLSAEKAKSDTARADLLKDIRSALHEAATMDAGFMGGDGTRYKKLKELLTSLG